jgi:hypothetical protein
MKERTKLSNSVSSKFVYIYYRLFIKCLEILKNATFQLGQFGPNFESSSRVIGGLFLYQAVENDLKN